MRKGYALVSLAVFGIAAIVLFTQSRIPMRGSNFQMTMMTEDEMEYIRYVSKFGKAYSSVEEYGRRALIYIQNKAKIVEANARNGVTYKLGFNKFSDWTKEEYRNLLKYKSQRATTTISAEFPETGDLPKKWDWRNHNAVLDVQDQG
jgi:hypothetical protein